MKSLLNQVLEDSSSEDEDIFLVPLQKLSLPITPKHGGSISGHRVLHRKREVGH
jgi:hypothetical protein